MEKGRGFVATGFIEPLVVFLQLPPCVLAHATAASHSGFGGKKSSHRMNE